MTINDGGPAFPTWIPGADGPGLQGGMSLRDWFAGQALQAFMRISYSSGGGYMQYATHAEEAARCAYQLADAMLKARS